MFKALRRYGVAVAADGENLRFDKCSAWMPGDDDGTALAADPAYCITCIRFYNHMTIQIWFFLVKIF